MEKTKKENKTLVRCTDCKIECTGKSINSIIEEMRCGRDGGHLRESCKTTLKSDGKNLFEVVPVKSQSKKNDDKVEE